MKRTDESWWPEGLSNASSSGAQDDMRYAFFSHQRRLALDRAGVVELYDSGDHLIEGVAQSADGSITFTTDKGIVDLHKLVKIDR